MAVQTLFRVESPPPSGFANMGTLVEIAERKRYHTYLKVLRDNADNIKERIRATHLVLAKLTEEKKKRNRAKFISNFQGVYEKKFGGASTIQPL